MQENNTVYIGFDRVAMYDSAGQPKIGLPTGWPYSDTFSSDSPIFNKSPEEIKADFGVEFPINWKEIEANYPIEFQSNLYLLLNYHYFGDDLPSGHIKVKYDTVENLVKENKPFYYVMYFMSNAWIHKRPIGLSPEVLKAVESGNCTVLFTLLCEGYFDNVTDVKWLSEFGTVNKLNPTNFIFSHSNYKFDETINKARADNITINFTYIPLNYFEYRPWFLPFYHPYNEVVANESKSKLTEFITDNRNKKVYKHFNILNRRPRQHRVVFFTEIMSTPELKSKSGISLGNEGLLNSNERIIKELEYISYTYPEYIPNYEFAKTHDFTTPVVLDVDLGPNRAGEYTRELYRDYFCTLTSETLVGNGTLFFSEKTFKPIYNLHPFIFLGNPFSLKKLKELGYKTFNRWWDESYDEEIDYLKRIKKISSVMKTVASWSEEECVQVTQDMEETLVHNFNNFFNNKRYEEFITYLYDRQIAKLYDRQILVKTLI